MHAGTTPVSRFPLATLLCAVVAVGATASAGLGQLIEDTRGFLAIGQLWRPITGHLAHAGTLHLVLNLAVFIPLSALRERRVGTRRLLLELLALSLIVAGGIRLLHDNWSTYRGLSGVVYGLFVLHLLRPEARPSTTGHGQFNPMPIALVAFLSLKSTLEYGAGGWLVSEGLFASSLGVAYLPGSHCAGCLGGAAIAALQSAVTLGRPLIPTQSFAGDSPNVGRDAQ